MISIHPGILHLNSLYVHSLDVYQSSWGMFCPVKAHDQLLDLTCSELEAVPLTPLSIVVDHCPVNILYFISKFLQMTVFSIIGEEDEQE